MKLLIYGSKDFAATVAELVRHCGHEVAGMIDDYHTGPGIIGAFDTAIHTHPPSEFDIAVAIGYSDLPARWAVWQRIVAAGYRAPALIHSRAYVAASARVGDGAMVMAGAIVDGRATIGELAVVWPGACINHDVRIGANTFISPNSTICGFASVGSHCFIGAGAVIVDKAELVDGSSIRMFSAYTQRPS